jgi:hypothetical protein
MLVALALFDASRPHCPFPYDPLAPSLFSLVILPLFSLAMDMARPRISFRDSDIPTTVTAMIQVETRGSVRFRMVRLVHLNRSFNALD